MVALKPTSHYATIVWLGRVPHRDRPAVEGEQQKALELAFGGPVGEYHSGLTRSSCSRVVSQHPKGTEIANVRQLSILSEEELSEIGRALAIEAMDPSWLGATVVLRGIEDLTHLPPSARLQAPDGATLVVDMHNQLCKLPGLAIQKALGRSGAEFACAADGRRGVTAWVERPGRLVIGDKVRLHLPDQRPWKGTSTTVA